MILYLPRPCRDSTLHTSHIKTPQWKSLWILNPFLITFGLRSPCWTLCKDKGTKLTRSWSVIMHEHIGSFQKKCSVRVWERRLDSCFWQKSEHFVQTIQGVSVCGWGQVDKNDLDHIICKVRVIARLADLNSRASGKHTGSRGSCLCRIPPSCRQQNKLRHCTENWSCFLENILIKYCFSHKVVLIVLL